MLQMPAISTPVIHQYVCHIGETEHWFLAGYNHTMIGYETFEFNILTLHHHVVTSNYWSVLYWMIVNFVIANV